MVAVDSSRPCGPACPHGACPWARVRPGRSWVSALGGLLLAVVATRVFDFEVLTVRSGSMEPAIARGDLIVVKPQAIERVNEGDIVLFAAGGDGIPTVHRVVGINEIEFRVTDTATGAVDSSFDYRLVTKGDANPEPDTAEVDASRLRGEVWFTRARRGWRGRVAASVRAVRRGRTLAGGLGLLGSDGAKEAAMKRLMIPVGAGVLALAGTVAVALGPNSSAEWGVDGTAGGVLSVQRSPAAVAGEPAPGDAPKPADGLEPRTPTVGAEPTARAEATSEPERTNTPTPTKESTSTPAAATVEPKNTPTLAVSPTFAPPPVLAEPAKEEAEPTKPMEPRPAKDEPAKPAEVPAPSVKVAEPANDTPATKTNARGIDRTR